MGLLGICRVAPSSRPPCGVTVAPERSDGLLAEVGRLELTFMAHDTATRPPFDEAAAEAAIDAVGI